MNPALATGNTHIDAAPRTGDAVLEFRDVSKRFGHRIALEGVNLALRDGTTLGIVGESGSGKSTCIRLALGLDRPTDGTILVRGEPSPRSRRGLRRMRRQLGFVFQDPYDSLDPRMTLRDIVGEPLRIHGAHRRDLDQRVSTALESVGLHDAPIDAYPAQYSGGGRQRIAIARALILDPEILLCDEPTSSLDVSVQAQILNLLLGLKTSRRLSVVFVSHDLDLIRRVADDIVVMYAGRVVEAGATDLVVSRPRHPYTVALLSAIPSDHPRKRKLGDRLAPKDTTIRGIDRSGCVYASRCRKVQTACREAPPAMVMEANDVRHACLYPENTHE